MNKIKKKNKDMFEKVLSIVSVAVIYGLLLITVGYNIYIFSSVSYKFNNENILIIKLLFGNFLLFMTLSYNYFKIFEVKK